MTGAGGAKGPPQALRLGVALVLFALTMWTGGGWVALLALVAYAAFALTLPPDVGLRPLRAGRALLVYVPFAAVWLLATTGYLHLLDALGHTVAPQPLLQRVAEDGLAGTHWILLGGVALAPVVEELTFRGYLLGVLLQSTSRVPAQLITAALFGWIHGLDYALPIAVLGLLFGWLRVRHGALGPAILVHAAHNALTFALAALWPGLLDIMYPG